MFDLTQASSDLPTDPVALTADEVKKLWTSVGGGGAAFLGPYAATLRTDLADRLVEAGQGVLPLLRPLLDISIDQQAQSLLDEAAKLKSDDSEVRLAREMALGDMGDKIWTLIRDVQQRELNEDQLVQLKNLLREVPRQRRFHVLDDVVRSFESPEAADFLRELAASARKRGDLEGNELARMAESVLGKRKPFRI